MTFEKFKQNVKCILYILKLELRGVHFVYFKEYGLSELHNLDEYEKTVLKLCAENRCGSLISEDWKYRDDEERFPDWKNRLKKVYGEKYSEEYIASIHEAMCDTIYVVKKNDIPYLYGNSKYVNHTNGSRTVVGQPKQYTNKIIVLGRSTIHGGRLEDADTIPSNMQSLANEDSNNILIAEYSASVGVPLLLLLTTDNHVLKRGDTVVMVHAQAHNVVADVCRLTGHYYSLRDVFETRHEWSGDTEIFFDTSHYNHVASKKLAEVIYGIVKTRYYKKNKNSKLRNYMDEIPKTSELFTELQEYRKMAQEVKSDNVGAIVMNCNPFTKGHEYLIDTALENVEFLYVFIVEENRSAFEYEDRLKLVQEHYKNNSRIKVIGSGKFMISKETFPEYFDKSKLQEADVNPVFDVEMFGKYIAPALNISKRFAGEEPLDNVTRQYNLAMEKILPEYGVQFIQIERKQCDGQVISASLVRKLYEEENWERLQKYVPEETFMYLQKLRG
jgi:[citrate (pro-3S)-lyase] ligase